MIRTQKELAKKFKISQMTISRALNDRPGVSQELKERILAYVEKYGFSTNRIAGSLVSGRTKIIGLVVPSMSYSFFPEITNCIEEICRERGYYTVLCHTGENYDRTAKEIRLLMGLRIAGLIIAPPANSNKINIYRELDKKHIPYVFIDRYLLGLKNSFVVSDSKKGSYEAVKYLISLGHRDILFIKGPPKATSAKDIYSGYVKAIKEYKLKEITLPSGFEEKDGYMAIKKMADSGLKPTAIMAVNDLVAIGALEALNELKINVPDDISLVGFSDLSIASKLSVPLTTVREDTQAMGEKAAEILFRMIDKKEKIVERIKLETKLIIRKSMRPIN